MDRSVNVAMNYTVDCRLVDLGSTQVKCTLAELCYIYLVYEMAFYFYKD